MIRAIAYGEDGHPRVLLGLDAGNLARLREGQPILVNLAHIDPGGEITDLPDIDVAIFFAGKDEMATLLAKWGES